MNYSYELKDPKRLVIFIGVLLVLWALDSYFNVGG
jgi:hypothetical protein